MATLRQQITVVLPRQEGTQLLDKLRSDKFKACPVAASSTLTVFMPTSSPTALSPDLQPYCTHSHTVPLSPRQCAGGSAGEEGICEGGLPGAEGSVAGDGAGRLSDGVVPIVAALFCELQGAVKHIVDIPLVRFPCSIEPDCTWCTRAYLLAAGYQ